MRNHSATHLMHTALRNVLGDHVQQKGSLVNAERTRFDFTHNSALTDDQIRRIEAWVNQEILNNLNQRNAIDILNVSNKMKEPIPNNNNDCEMKIAEEEALEAGKFF